MSQQWNEGYFTKTNYLNLYHADTSPAQQRYAALTRGFETLPESADSHHCELGFGQGVSLAIHAACQPGTFWGNDFTPSQVAAANTLVEASGSGAQLFDDSFEQFLQRPDLPQFDSISLHGIWSWVSEKNRQFILEFARRQLKPGGLFYVSYNALPGQLSTHPMRHMMLSHARLAAPPAQPIREQVDGALQFFSDLLAARPDYAQAQANADARLEFIRKLDRQYLAHEYFNANWQCFYFSDVVDALEEAKLEFVGNLDSGKLPALSAEAQAFLNTINHDIMHQQVLDYFVNRMFRKDIFVRGGRRMATSEQYLRLFNKRFCLLTPRAKISQVETEPGTPAAAIEQRMQEVADWLAADGYAPKTLAQFAAASDQRHSNEDLLYAMVALINREQATACQSEAANEQARAQTLKLNHHLLERAHFENHSIDVLASPVTGGAIQVGHSGQLFLAALANGYKSAAELARFCWQIFHTQGSKVMKDDQPLSDEAESIAELERRAKLFLEEDFALLEALQVL